jgi:hypothetical protein
MARWPRLSLNTNSLRLLRILLALGVLILASCSTDIGNLSLSGPYASTVRVHVRNSSAADFSVLSGPQPAAARPIPVGSSADVVGHFSFTPVEDSYTLDILRTVALARVTYRILQYPVRNGDEQHVTIKITEPAAGTFSVETVDTSWIKVLSIKSLP